MVNKAEGSRDLNYPAYKKSTIIEMVGKNQTSPVDGTEILNTLERVASFAKWAPKTGLFNRRYGIREQGETDP